MRHRTMSDDTNDTDDSETEENERKQITVWVDADKKKEWEAYAESNGINYLSRLIRKSVFAEINGDNHPRQGSQDIDSDIEELQRSVERIEEKVNGMNSDVQSIRRSTARPPPHVENITNDVYALLPSIEPGTGEWVNQTYYHDEGKRNFEKLKEKADRQQNPDPTAWSGEPEQIQIALESDVSADDVREACERLMTDTSRVRRKTIRKDNTPDPAGLSMGQTVYWKDE